MALLDSPIDPAALLARSEGRRVQALTSLPSDRRVKLGQFFTPEPVADLISRMIDVDRLPASVRLLDPGAGTGSLTAAVFARLLRDGRTRSLEAVAYEVDDRLLDVLEDTLSDCVGTAGHAGLRVRTEVRGDDFVAAAVAGLLGSGGLFSVNGTKGLGAEDFDLIVMNPPYRKIHSASRERWLLSQAGLAVNNIYTAFLALAGRLLRPGGQLAAITPRSFCNGPYFRSFRRDFLGRVTLQALHVFESRDTAFGDSDVLQENVILRAVRGAEARTVTISASVDHAD